jgi:hypothetical protein
VAAARRPAADRPADALTCPGAAAEWVIEASAGDAAEFDAAELSGSATSRGGPEPSLVTRAGAPAPERTAPQHTTAATTLNRTVRPVRAPRRSWR